MVRVDVTRAVRAFSVFDIAELRSMAGLGRRPEGFLAAAKPATAAITTASAIRIAGQRRWRGKVVGASSAA
jgi:hypothetical protein